MKRNGFWRYWVPVVLLTLGWAMSNGEAMADNSVCAECHEEVASVFANSFHGRAWMGKNGCESCHGSADSHKNDPSAANIISFGKGSVQSATEKSAPCLGCHSSATHLALWDMGKHARNDVACVNCHTIHTRRAAVKQPEVCFGCHGPIRMDANKSSHHPIIEGKVKCSDCHNTHGSLSRAMLIEDNVNQLCYRCHAEKRGPFVWEHPPVEEDCAICHSPHGSRHENLLTEKIPNLCQDCHDWSRHPGTLYSASGAFNGASPSNRFYSRSCLNCHGAIHGSTNFENHFMTR